MCDSGIFTETATDRIHRNYKLRIIVFYGGKVTKLPFDRVGGSEQIGYLNIYPIVCLGSNKVYLPGTKNTDRNVKALSPEMVLSWISKRLTGIARYASFRYFK